MTGGFSFQLSPAGEYEDYPEALHAEIDDYSDAEMIDRESPSITDDVLWYEPSTLECEMNPSASQVAPNERTAWATTPADADYQGETTKQIQQPDDALSMDPVLWDLTSSNEIELEGRFSPMAETPQSRQPGLLEAEMASLNTFGAHPLSEPSPSPSPIGPCNGILGDLQYPTQGEIRGNPPFADSTQQQFGQVGLSLQERHQYPPQTYHKIEADLIPFGSPRRDYRMASMNETTFLPRPSIGWPSAGDDPWSQFRPRGHQEPPPPQGYGATWLSEPPPLAPPQSCDCSSTSGIHSPTTPMSFLADGTNQMSLSDSTATLKLDGRPNDYFPATEPAFIGHDYRHESSDDPELGTYETGGPMLSRYLGPNLSEGYRPSSGFPSSGRQERQFLSPRALSTVSAASSVDPDPLVCATCGKTYSGEYRRGNLARHNRQKHGVTEQIYPCREPGCGKEFKRQDARLKHYRRRHSHLAPEPPVTRLQ